MSLPVALFFGGLFLVVSTLGRPQKTNLCNIDPDIIFFHDERLEKLREAIKFGRECSPVVMKSEVDNVLQNQLRSEKDKDNSSGRERKLLNHLTGNNEPQWYGNDGALSSENRREPISRRFPDRYYESQSQGNPQHQFLDKKFFNHEIQEFSNEKDNSGVETQRKHQSQQRPSIFRPTNSQMQGWQDNVDSTYQGQSKPRRRPEENILKGNNQRQPPSHNGFFIRNDPKRDRFQGRPNEDEQRGHFNPERPDGFLRPNDQKKPQRQDTFFSPQSQRRPQNEGIIFTPKNPGRLGPSRNFFNPDSDSKVPFRDEYPPRVSDYERERIPNQLVTKRPHTTRRPRLEMESTTLPGPPTWATPASLCVRRCPNTPEYNPVCGSDKVTYRNLGRLHCEQHCGKGDCFASQRH